MPFDKLRDRGLVLAQGPGVGAGPGTRTGEVVGVGSGVPGTSGAPAARLVHRSPSGTGSRV